MNRTTMEAPGSLKDPADRSIGRIRALAEIVAVIVAFLLTATLLGPLLGVPLAALALYGGVFAAWGFLRLSRTGWREIGIRAPDDPRGTVLAAAGVAAIGVALYLGVRAAERLGLPALDLSVLREAIQGDFLAYVLTMAVVVWGSAAFAEELIFRGFIVERLLTVFHGVPGALYWVALAQAGLFGLAHSYQGVTGVLFSGTIGLFLFVVYWARNRNMWAPILAHGLMDTVAVTLLYLGVW